MLGAGLSDTAQREWSQGIPSTWPREARAVSIVRLLGAASRKLPGLVDPSSPVVISETLTSMMMSGDCSGRQRVRGLHRARVVIAINAPLTFQFERAVQD